MNEKEYSYYWYHHMAFTSEECQKIDKIILDHDWNAFMEYYKKYDDRYYEYKGDRYKICYFPDTIDCFDDSLDEDDENYYTEIPLNEENFKLITFAEHECG